MMTLEFGASGSVSADDVITLNADLLPGVTAPAISVFIFTGSKLVDDTGNVVNEASLTLR